MIDKDELIGELTKIMLQQEFEDRGTGKTKYVKRTRAFKDLIKFIKEYM